MVDKNIKMMNQKRTTEFPSTILQALREMGEFIACARKEKSWTQEELAKRIGVNRVTLVRIEKGSLGAAIGWYPTAAWLLGL